VAELCDGSKPHVVFAVLKNVAVAWEGVPQPLHIGLRLIIWVS